MTLLTRTGILSASDRCAAGERKDESGLLLKTLAESLPSEVVAYQVVSDDPEPLQKVLLQMVDLFKCDLILTTGGTGLSPRDNTPEATQAVIEREIPGIAEAVRSAGLAKTKFAALSRGLAGLRGKTLIINLPGSPEAVLNSFEVLAPLLTHALDLVHGRIHDCKKIREAERKEPPCHTSRFSHSHS